MFDIHQSIYDRHGEQDEALIEQYINGVMEEFANSPEAQPLIEEYSGVGWAVNMMEFGISYIGVTPANMSRGDFEEIVFELFPRKMSTKPETAPAIVAELKAFWSFGSRQYGLPNARQILKTFDDRTAERLQKALADPSNWGMAKSMVMMGSEAGFDMTTKQGIDEFMAHYNSNLANLGPPPMNYDVDYDDDDDDYDPMPLPPERPTGKELKKKRQQRKAQRQARKRNRKRR